MVASGSLWWWRWHDSHKRFRVLRIATVGAGRSMSGCSNNRDHWGSNAPIQLQWAYHLPEYHASFQNWITFNFWLCTYPIFEHWLPIHHGFPSFTLRSSSNSLQCTAIDQHDQSRWPQVHIEDSSDIEMEDLSKPNCTLKLQKSLWSLKSTQSTIQSKQCPIMALPIVPQPSPMYPLCFPSLHEWYCYRSSHSYLPTVSSTFTTPETI